MDPAEINKNIVVTASVIGDVKEILGRLDAQLDAAWSTKNGWIISMAYKEKYPLTYHPEGLSGPYIVEQVYRMTKGEAIMVTEVGQHQMWTAQYYRYAKPRTLLTSGGLGTMGYGLGAAIGAQVGESG